jgi:hypothetical protein
MNDDSSKPSSAELKARRAFEARRGEPFTEEEWEEAKRNLVGIFLMLGLDSDDRADDE